jgi:FkbM family methyltransferase
MGTMRSSQNLLLMSQDRALGLVSREEYWETFREFARELQFIAELQTSTGTEILVANGEILVNIQTSGTHRSRMVMHLNPEDLRSMPFSILADGFYEPFQADVLIELGKRSKKFIDVGANTGYYSIALAMENKDLEVFSFEPQPEVHKLLVLNLTTNDLNDRVTPVNVALGDEQNLKNLFVPKFTGTVGASFQNLHEEEGNASVVTVEVQRLDEFIKTRIDLIKIDVEGYESSVLRGSERVINQYQPTVMVELLRKWMKPFNTTPHDFLQKMLAYGYICFSISSDSLIQIEEINEETIETNFIFAHQENRSHLEFLKSKIDKNG